jgi:hypothetical protein
MVFIVFMLRRHGPNGFIRPIGGRYTHKKEIERYEKDNPRAVASLVQRALLSPAIKK